MKSICLKIGTLFALWAGAHSAHALEQWGVAKVISLTRSNAVIYVRDSVSGKIRLQSADGLITTDISGAERVVSDPNYDILVGNFSGVAGPLISTDMSLDLLARDRSSGTLEIYRGSSSRTDAGQVAPLHEFKFHVKYGPIGANVELQLQNMNGDGFLDLMGRDPSTGIVYLYYSTGDLFSYAGKYGPIGVNVNLMFGDLDADGMDDLMGRDVNSGIMYNFLATGSSFSYAGNWGPIGMNCDILFADVNGDRAVELVARDRNTGNTWIFPMNKGRPTGQFRTAHIPGNVELAAGNVSTPPASKATPPEQRLRQERAEEIVARDRATGAITVYSFFE